MMRMRFLPAFAIGLGLGCAGRLANHSVPQPPIIPHSQWQAQPPLGYAADATRRNKKPGDTLSFHDLKIGVLSTAVDSTGAKPTDIARLRLELGDMKEDRVASE